MNSFSIMYKKSSSFSGKRDSIQFIHLLIREPKMGINDENDQVSYKYIGDALALRGDERRSTLR